jgi:hypothetical protein
MSEILLPLHLLSLLYILWNIAHADHLGFSWMRGKIKILNEEKVHVYHRGSWVGLSCMLFTGFLLFLPMREYLLTRPQFYIKMAFVITLICNGFVIGKLQKTATTKTYASLSFYEKAPLVTSGAISITAWIGSIVTSFYLIEEF